MSCCSVEHRFHSFDLAVFFLHEDGVLTGVVAARVDDFMWSGCKEFEERVVTKLRELF